MTEASINIQLYVPGLWYDRRHETCRVNPLSIAVPFWGRMAYSLCCLSPKRDCTTQRIYMPKTLPVRGTYDTIRQDGRMATKTPDDALVDEIMFPNIGLTTDPHFMIRKLQGRSNRFTFCMI